MNLFRVILLIPAHLARAFCSSSMSACCCIFQTHLYMLLNTCTLSSCAHIAFCLHVYMMTRLSSCQQEGMVYLTSSYVAFTTLFKDKDIKTKSATPGKPSTMGKLFMMMGGGSAGADDGYQPDTTLLISLRVSCLYILSLLLIGPF